MDCSADHAIINNEILSPYVLTRTDKITQTIKDSPPIFLVFVILSINELPSKKKEKKRVNNSGPVRFAKDMFDVVRRVICRQAMDLII